MTANPEVAAVPFAPEDNALNVPVCVWDLKAELGEGPVWSEAEKALWFVDILGRRLHRYDPVSAATHSWNAPLRPCFLVPLRNGGLLCGLEDGLSHFDPVSGTFTEVIAVEPDLPGNRINDGHVDPTGRLWFGTMDDAEENPTGSLYSIGDGHKLIRHHGGYTVSNGPAVSPDSRTLYQCDSALGTIYVFDIATDGTLGSRRVFARIEDGAPDGLAMDSTGTLWSGIWGGGRIERFRPDGSRLDPIAVPAKNVTKVAFGGSDGKTVFVTTARKGLSGSELAEKPQTGGLFCLRTEIPGRIQEALAFPAVG
ncbi:SMP-30/gluconolactonase/LRE family protein [Acetobacter oeni]|uniref:Gluconolaconase n=1 Tax=Acetobacter oeni TaxID=304077 RepID=A0A511XPM3_9PROT|nr:SMP-30/gluconolactonase/LRE family protein [Acetobacter oeni]MBB3881862.1 sugar lactone lactonase YvrE [Acetobacter oeni]NHO17811.1 SMP-30/gluconolactonase/LRE family protein [Acetobacter oeni]GBR08653.1 transcriptional regulator [Acetobacter oeni LMG 21952]GEN64854.1 gluconolaconase [Acetobacter oeni]